MGIVSTVEYLGNLRTKSVHTRSGDAIISDAPLDNNGKGEAFSPTDMTATSLANCALTLMGIKASSLNIQLSNVVAEVEKVMAENPRRIAALTVRIKVVGNYSSEEKQSLERVAINCPVAKSLHPSVVQSFDFVWLADK